MPKLRTQVVEGLQEIIDQAHIPFDALAGIVTGGLPYASILADRLGKPLVYVRPQAKSHGTKKQVEGHLEAGMRVLVIEDLVSTAQSVLHAVQALREAGARVEHTLAIFSYGLAVGQKALEQAHCQLYTLSNLETLLTVAANKGIISPEQKNYVLRFSQDPKGWLVKETVPVTS